MSLVFDELKGRAKWLEEGKTRGSYVGVDQVELRLIRQWRERGKRYRGRGKIKVQGKTSLLPGLCLLSDKL